ncbi:MAG: hypothetical protein KJ734_03250, partial [Chloroflexi bacterium]|nr:hypothetical protein [Chloroflexota bacterium]
LPGYYRVAPAPRWEVREEDDLQRLEPVYDVDATIGAGDVLYPADLARVVNTGYVRSQRVTSLELSPVQYRPATGELRLVRRLRVRLDFAYPDAAAERQGVARAEESSFEGILSRSLLNYKEAQTWRAAPADSALAAVANHWTPPDPAWKVLVNETGLYRLTYTDLQTAGLPVDTLDPRTFQLYNQGAEVAIHVIGQDDTHFDSGDAVEFYGQALDTRYTNTNVYWLTYGAAAGLRMGTRNGTPTDAPIPTVFTTTARFEDSVWYWPSVPAGDDFWFWERMYATSAVYSPTHPLTATLTGAIGLVSTDTVTCTVGIYLYGTTYTAGVNPDHHAIVYLNDHWIHDAQWDGQTPYSALVEVPQAYLVDMTNTLRIDMPADTGAQFDGIYVNKFTIDYGHRYQALNDELAFTQESAGTWQYRITDLSDPDVLLFDVTDPAHVARITGAVPWDGYRVFLPLVSKNYATGSSGGSTPTDNLTHLVRFQDTTAGPTSYLALGTGQARTPLSITADTPSDLGDTANQADYVMIAYDDFAGSTQPLATYWQSQGINTMLVPISDVYDEFSYGVFDPTAIRDFLAYAYANWQTPQLAYVLLVGDATYDYRDYKAFDRLPGVPVHLLPTPVLGETGSDNWYACVSGTDYLPDLHIGRLPANSTAQVDVMVNKTLDYAQSPPAGTWNQDVLFVADNADSGGPFDYYSDLLVNGYIPPTINPIKVYYKITHSTQKAATYAITTTVNSGALLVNYIGHGGWNVWTGEKLLYCVEGSRCDFGEMVNGGKQPFVVSMTCLDGYFLEPNPAKAAMAERW